MTHILAPLPVDPRNPAAILDELEKAIAGQTTLLPLPAADRTRAELLRNHMRAGESIAEDIALVVATSGSTGTPKGAQLSPLNLVASADATHSFLGGPGQWLLAMPAHHIAGIQVLVRSLVAGVEPLCLDLSQGFNITEFARAAEELAHTEDRMYTALTPMQLHKALDSLDGIQALRRFNSILVGGAAPHPQLLESARKLDITVVTTYGSSETAGGCVYNGTPLPGTEVRIGDDNRIFLGGPTIAQGYRNVESRDFVDGWFATSDAGELDAHGQLTVTGRLDNIINSGGLKLHPEQLEQLLLQVPGVDSACVVGIPDPRLGQMIAAAYTGWASRTDILEALDDLPRWQIPREIIRIAEMPLTGPGKVDRRGVAGLFKN
ncbi:O-succinylbenzoic acid--CoA ligase [Corynebacterium sp. HMSC06G04]|uniref:o-succinylbenzoate--CoA ligase n=1 Tax=Corynebacterium sp. HMSC06G04 TaxID=1581126 RepID=UPI0008A2BA55|nr:o-succinylbenzoate--CoA ligase [Corynebacterium sp. HMSC06G04]OFT46616.1 O-succinylbenzoic acid--CoA ligase [Corynebacterium sp. HMSC06G04]